MKGLHPTAGDGGIVSFSEEGEGDTKSQRLDASSEPISMLRPAATPI